MYINILRVELYWKIIGNYHGNSFSHRSSHKWRQSFTSLLIKNYLSFFMTLKLSISFYLISIGRFMFRKLLLRTENCNSTYSLVQPSYKNTYYTQQHSSALQLSLCALRSGRNDFLTLGQDCGGPWMVTDTTRSL